VNKIIEITNLNFSYGNQKVLDNINITVEKNDFIGIIGPNGGGKTTLIKLILRILKPDSGEIIVVSKSPTDKPYKIGYVPQYYNLKKDFPITASEILMMGLSSSASFFPWESKKSNNFDKVVDSLLLETFLEKKFGELSGGEQQRILIGRAVISNPEILILDEPTSSVDSSIEENIYLLLKEYNSDMTILLVSHDIAYISSYINKVACINKNLTCHGIDEISHDKIIDEVYHGHVSAIKHKCGL